jgi:L-rhamnose mutarotase
MKKTFLMMTLVTIFLIAGCTQHVQRFGSVIGVKAEMLDKYKELHANPWPEINSKLKDVNIRNYSIYLTQFPDGKYYLFSYFEYTGDDFKADMAKIAADPKTQEWWKETDPCQFGLENRAEGEWWKSMEEVYHLD